MFTCNQKSDKESLTNRSVCAFGLSKKLKLFNGKARLENRKINKKVLFCGWILRYDNLKNRALCKVVILQVSMTQAHAVWHCLDKCFEIPPKISGSGLWIYWAENYKNNIIYKIQEYFAALLQQEQTLTPYTHCGVLRLWVSELIAADRGHSSQWCSSYQTSKTVFYSIQWLGKLSIILSIYIYVSIIK